MFRGGRYARKGMAMHELVGSGSSISRFTPDSVERMDQVWGMVGKVS